MKSWILVWTVFVAALWAGCSENRSDPLAPGGGTGDLGGSLRVGGDGPNLAVTELNKLDLCQQAFEQCYSSYNKATTATALAPFSGETIRITGAYSGYALVQGAPEQTDDGQTIKLQLSITYYDFSESGSLFIGGKVDFQGSVKRVVGSVVPADVYLNDGLVFAGDYSGSMELENFRLPVDSRGGLIDVYASKEILEAHPHDGSVTIKSEGNIIRFNPYYRSSRPEEPEEP